MLLLHMVADVAHVHCEKVAEQALVSAVLPLDGHSGHAVVADEVKEGVLRCLDRYAGVAQFTVVKAFPTERVCSSYWWTKAYQLCTISLQWRVRVERSIACSRLLRGTCWAILPFFDPVVRVAFCLKFVLCS